MYIFSWGFPPNQSTGAIIPADIVLAASRRGWDTVVIAAPIIKIPGQPSLEIPPFGSNVTILRPNLEVDEIERPIRRPFYRLTSQIDGGMDVALIMTELAMRHARRRKPAILLSSGPDFAGFVAATMTQLGLGADSKVVFQYRDEWTVQTPPYVSVASTSRFWEWCCLQSCAAVTFVTPGKLRAYQTAFPFLKNKALFVHRNGVRLANPAVRETTSKRKERYRISFIGRFSEPKHLFPFLADLRLAIELSPDLLDNFEFEIVGSQAEDYQRALENFTTAFPNILQLHGHVSSAEAVALMESSDALLLMCEARYEGWVPLKLFDYMGTSRPILAYGTVSEAAEIVKATGAGIVVPTGQPKQLLAALETLRTREDRQWISSQRLAWVAEHNRSGIMDDLIARISELVN